MAGTGTNAGNIIISAVNIKWRIEHRSLFDVSNESDPDGTYFDIFDTDGATARVHFNLDAGSTPPATPAGGRLIEVAVSSGDAASVIATATAAAITADSKFVSAAPAGTVVQVDGAAVGEVIDPDPGTSATVVTVCYKGKDFDLGLLEGEPAFNFEPQLLDITSQQTGTTILSKLIQGYTGNVETVLQETTFSKLEDLYKIYGESFNPGTAVYGAGTGSIGKNMVVEAARLEFIPVNSSLSAELGYNVEYALAIPTPGALAFSGENPRTLTVTWDALPELGATRSNLDFVRVGDASQVGVR
jgi:hypothetical protein